MGKYSVIAKKIEKLGGTILRGDESFSTDLDVYVPKRSLCKVHDYLLSDRFVLTYESSGSRHYKKIMDDVLYFVDVNMDLNYFFHFFTSKLKQTYIEEYLNNVEQNAVSMRTLRYLFLFRVGKKYSDFFKKNKDEIIRNNFYLSYVENSPFKKELEYRDLDFFLKRKPKVLIKYLGCLGFCKLYYRIFKQKVVSYRVGEIVSVLGTDGVGKTTVISMLCKNYGFKSIYLGAGDYKTKNMSRTIKGKYNNFFIKLFLALLFYIENWKRMLIAYRYKYQGKTVLLDRHPYYDGLGAYKKMQYGGMHRFLYKNFFPKGNKAIILYASPEVILKRKAERTKEEIVNFYADLMKNLKGKNVFQVENKSINETMYKISRVVFE